MRAGAKPTSGMTMMNVRNANRRLILRPIQNNLVRVPSLFNEMKGGTSFEYRRRRIVETRSGTKTVHTMNTKFPQYSFVNHRYLTLSRSDNEWLEIHEVRSRTMRSVRSY